MSGLRPMGDRVLVRRTEAAKVSKGGVFIPEKAQDKPQEGTVLSVGNGLPNKNGTRVAPDVQVDDLILFSKMAGVEVKIGDETLVVLKETDILGVLQ